MADCPVGDFINCSLVVHVKMPEKNHLSFCPNVTLKRKDTVNGQSSEVVSSTKWRGGTDVL